MANTLDVSSYKPPFFLQHVVSHYHASTMTALSSTTMSSINIATEVSATSEGGFVVLSFIFQSRLLRTLSIEPGDALLGFVYSGVV